MHTGITSRAQTDYVQGGRGPPRPPAHAPGALGPAYVQGGRGPPRPPSPRQNGGQNGGSGKPGVAGWACKNCVRFSDAGKWYVQRIGQGLRSCM